MSYATRAGSVTEHFRAQLALVRPTLPIAYDNDDRPRLADGSAASVTAATEHVVVSVRETGSRFLEIGRRNREESALFVVEILVPVAKGTGSMREIARDVAAIFDLPLSGVSFGEPRLDPVDLDGAWEKAVYTVPFRADFAP